MLDSTYHMNTIVKKSQFFSATTRMVIKNYFFSANANWCKTILTLSLIYKMYVPISSFNCEFLH